MESWRKVWREGFGKAIDQKGLEALRDALEKDDRRLMQGGTTHPPSCEVLKEKDCDMACAVGVTGLIGRNLSTVGEVEEYFSEMCLKCDKLIGEYAGCRWFLNWFDETPRETMIRELLEEVKLSLAEKYQLLPA